jgi:hypothetical protein
MELDYQYVTVRCYKPHKGYTDETHMIGTIDFVFDSNLSEEENVARSEKEYMEVYAPDLNCEVVGSISAMYKAKPIKDDPVADAELENLFN